MYFDFNANATVDALERVPEAYRGLYVAKDGKFVVSDAAKTIVEAYMGVSGALTKTKGDLAKANEESATRRTSLKRVEDAARAMGLEGDDSVATTLAHIEDLTKKVKNGEQLNIDLGKIRQEQAKALKEATDAKDAEIAKKDGALTKYLVNQAATAELAGAKGSIDLLLPIVQSHAKVVADGDDYMVRVVDANGDVRTDGKGGFLTVKGFVQELKVNDKYARAFDSESPSGTGSRPGSAKIPATTRQQEGDKTSVDKISAGLAKKQYISGAGAR